MASKSRVAEKSSINQIVVAVRDSAQRIVGSAQYTVKKTQDDGIILVSRFAQKNLLALAGRADQVSKALTDLSLKLEPSDKAVASKRKPAARKAAAKPVQKTSHRRAAAA